MANKPVSSQIQDNRNREGTEPNKKLKKMRSIKLSRKPSLKPSRERSKTRFIRPPIDSYSDDSSPKSFDPVKESFQVKRDTEGVSERPSSSGSTGTTPSSQNFHSRINGGNEVTKTSIKSGSTELPTFGSSSPSRKQTQPRSHTPLALNYLKATSCSHDRKANSQASPHFSESSFGSDDQSISSNSSKPNPDSSSKNSTLKIRKILMNKSSFKSKRPLVKTSSEVSRDSFVDRATCSSAIKDSKFVHHVEVNPRESESERILAAKACPYNYCSLHGHHHHDPVPLPKRALPKKRRLVKTQKSMKLKSLSTRGEKSSGDLKNGIQTSKSGHKVEPSRNSNNGYANPRAEFFQGSDEKDDNKLSEVLFGETSYPEKSFQENLNELQDFLAAEENFVEKPSEIQGKSIESCCIETTQDKSISGSAEKELKHENMGTHLEVLDSNSENCEADHDLEGEKLEIGDLTGGNEASEKAERSSPDFSSKVTEEKGVISEETSSLKEEKNGVSRENGESMEAFSSVSTTQLKKEKHISMWNLIHQHMVLGLSEEEGTQKHEREVEKEKVEEAKPTSSSSGSGLGFSKLNQNMAMENHDRESQEIELRKVYAIKLVREAIEKILLPEVLDPSSDDQSITSDVNPDQELTQKNHRETEKESSRERDEKKVEDEKALDPEEKRAEKKAPKSWSNLKKWILLQRFVKALEKVKKFNPKSPRYFPSEPEPETEKVHLKRQMLGGRKSSEEWMLDYALQQVVSELAPTQKRKVSLIVKAFETIVPPSEEKQVLTTFSRIKAIGRNFNGAELGKSDSEGRETNTKEEENCLISLVSVSEPSKEFSEAREGKSREIESETEIASERTDTNGKEEEYNGEKSSVLVSDTLKELSAAPEEGSREIEPETEIALESGETNRKEEEENAEIYSVSVSDPSKELSAAREEKSRETESDTKIYSEGRETNRKEEEENGEISSVSDSDPLKEFRSAREEKSTEIEPETEIALESIDTNRSQEEENDEIFSDSISDLPKEPSADQEEKSTEIESENEIVGGFDSVRNSEPKATAFGSYKTKFKEEKHISMWHLIHQHMVSGLSAEAEAELPEGTDKKEEAYETNTAITPKSSLKAMENQEMELRKVFAIKLVREAIEKILLPEVQDQSSDDQSVTSDVIPETELIEKSHSEVETPITSTSIDNIPSGMKEETKASMVETKSEKQTPKSWSRLKKLILLKRFVKELEKVRKFNPRKPRILPMESEAEAEKVSLKHQTTGESRNGEEWMLDYALRKVIGEMDQTQKRKVALLVKAFETVVPPSEEKENQSKFSRDKDNSCIEVTGVSNLENGENSSIADEQSQATNLGSQLGKDLFKKFDKIESFEDEKAREEAREDDNGESTGATKNTASPDYDQESAAMEEKNEESEPLEMYKTKMDMQNYIKMWHQIYQHVVSNIAEKVLNEEDEEKQVKSPSTFPEAKTSGSSRDSDNQNPTRKRIEFTQIDAVKLVREAIDEILLPEIEKETVSKANVSTSEEEKSESMVGIKSEQHNPKNWRKIKKIILLKRSIKALENVRKFNPGDPRNLLTKAEPEGEKVDLMHQMMDERKKAEQWMLDYAVQHIVTKLTPARKRRVSMLVEAFEAVVPLPEL